MAKVITYSRTFPAYHPKKGRPTYFVEKFWKSIEFPKRKCGFFFAKCNELNQIVLDTPTKKLEFYDSINGNIVDVKSHTIRSGNRWKKGDYFSPRVWSGKPYNSKQIIIAPDTLITDVWDFEIKPSGTVFIDGDIYTSKYNNDLFGEIAQNDGLELQDLKDWFKYPTHFMGQIICWNEKIKY